MACYLYIWGKFDPDVLASATTVPVKKTWREGTPSRRGKVHEDSGLQICASAADFGEHKRQFAEAEAFLRGHHAGVAAMTKRPDTLDSILDFGFLQTPHPAYFRRVPASLVQVAASLNLAIELSFYAFGDDDEDDSTIQKA